MRLLIEGALVLTMDPVLGEMAEARVGVEGQDIAFVLQQGQPLPPGWKPDRTLDACGRLLMPGLVNAHTHVPMTLLRGYADDLPLHTWLFDHVMPAEDRLTADDAYWGTLLGAAEMIRAGITAFADMYFFEDAIARAVLDSGMRASLGRGLVEQGAPGNLEDVRFLQRDYEGAGEGRVTTMVAPHSVYTCSPAFLERCAALAQELGTGVHVHLSETTREVEECLSTHGVTPVALAKKTGLLDGHTLVAHAVDLREGDADILAAMRGAVVHNPQSNQKLASGIAPVAELLARGATVALGTDGASSANTLDLLEAGRWAAYAQKAAGRDASLLPARTVLAMATTGGAAAMGVSDRVGRVAPGFQADLVLLNLDRPHLVPSFDPYSTVVYSARADDVETVLVAGQVLMEKRALLTIDEERVVAEARERIRKFAR
ncbi:MAG: amidohydrolase [Bacillota bacterium]